VIKAFTPRHENYPTFQSATVSSPDGKDVALRVSLISINRETEIRAQIKTKKSHGAALPGGPSNGASAGSLPSSDQTQSNNAEPATAGGRNGGLFVTLEAANPAASGEGFALPGPVTLAAGTMAKIILLGGVSASKSRPGDSFQARLVEPVRLDSQVVLPEGTLLRRKGCEEHTSASVEPGRFAFACVHGSDFAGEYKHSGAGVGHRGGARPKVAHQD
jgi:hypothetical protein